MSKEGHFWTVLHYAAHYGHVDVLDYLIDLLKSNENFFEIFNMQTLEGKTPLFCAVLSGDINLETKKEIMKKIFDRCQVDLQLRKSTGEDLCQMAKKNHLYEFLVEFCLRED